MIKLFLATLAGTTARLKSTVTRLLQAPVTDAACTEDPPHALRPLRADTSGRLARSRARHLLTGTLLSCLCLLTLLALALPMQTTAHIQRGSTGYLRTSEHKEWVHRLENRAGTVITTGAFLSNYKRGHEAVPTLPPNEIIKWVRVYKNPKTVSAAELIRQGLLLRNWPPGEPTVPDLRELASMRWYNLGNVIAPLLASYHGVTVPSDDIFWVEFDADGNLLPDPANPGNSGLVTATENTSVVVGDIVAIAVKITSWGGMCIADLAIGPLEEKPYTWGSASTARSERRWRLNPNLPLRNYELRYGNYSPTSPPAGVIHTLVYQFKVEEKHLVLNGDGPWLKLDWTLPTETRDVTQRTNLNGDPGEDKGQGQVNFFPQYGPFDWIWDAAEDARPTHTSVKVFNCFNTADRFLVDWGLKHLTPTDADRLWGYTLTRSQIHTEDTNNMVKNKIFTLNADGKRNHVHIPLYDPGLSDKDDIFYPKIEGPDSRATTTMVVPEDTQTGEFTVTLSFVDGGIFEGHDLSETGLESFKTKLDAALADWTVMSLEVLDEHRPTIASSGADILYHSASTQYTLKLSPPEGVIDEFALQIPKDIVMDVGGNGNDASAEVMISVDSSLTRGLPLAEGGAVEVAEPEAGSYSAGDVIEVLVPFAEDGLTYEGTNPPYLTIYLGAGTANPRHATWQKGQESAGSTIVPFAYEIAVTDPIVDSVRVDTDAGVLRPKGTVLKNGADQVWVEGDKPKPMGSGEDAPVPTDADAGLSILTDTSAPLPEVEASVQVLPLVYLPPDESAPKAGLSSVPRSPIVFNELGNGSGDTNDWLELRNVTGSDVSLKEWELSVVQDGKKEDTSLVIFPDVSVPADGLLLITNSDPTAEGNLLAGGDDIATADVEQKGSSHLYLVNAGLSLPDDGQFLLILRNTKEKLGLNEAFVDVAGGGGSGTDAFIRETTGDYDTYVWPLQVLEAPESATEDALSSGKVWLRAKADIVGYHRDAWGEAAFTGVGYDRNVPKSAETAGTPGYPNGAVKTEAPTPRGAITISEVMLDSAGGTLPQWIELYNASKTDALNLNRWELEIQNVDSEELVGRPIVRLTLQEKVIQPNQTLLIVTGNARASSADVFPADRVYNLLELHDKNLRIKKPSDTFLSAMGFYLRLTDRNENTVDEVGNTDGNRRTDDTPAWALPIPLSGVEGMRSSLIRRYDKGVARDGTSRQGWALAANFARFKADGLHYGHADDIGTPGYRQGGALPVELSSFSVTRLESGSVIVTWTTESEVDNAGFNLRRSLTRENGFTLLNPVLIAGAGTTGERQTYTFIDTSAKPGVEHYYQLEEVSFGGKPETLVTRRLRGPVSASHRALKTLGEVKQREE